MSDFISSDHHLNQQRWSDLNVEVSPFRSAFEHAAIGMVLSDMDGRCLAANRAFCEMVGYSEDELLQMEFAQITHPDDLPENLRLGHQLLSGEISTFRLEKRYFHKQGHTLWGLLSASLVRDSHGLPLYVISQIQDITEWRQAQAALARSEANQRAMLNAMPDVVLQLGRDARVLACHGPVEQVLALPRAALLGRSLDELLTAPQWQLAAEAIERAHQTGQLQMMEFTQQLHGRPRFYEGRFTTTSTQDILLLIRDVTQRQLARLAELEQRELAEALRDTAAALSSTLNMDELLDRVLLNLQRVVTHEAADVMLVDADQVAHITRRRGYSDVDGGDMSRAVRFPVVTTTNLRRMTDSRAPLIIADVRHQPGWVQLPALHWVRSYVGAPLCTKQAVIGFIGLMSSQSDFFNADDAERLQAFAQQAAIAIDNVRLFQAERAQSDLAEALRDTAAALNSTLNLDEVLDRILANASRVVPYDAINIMLLDERGGPPPPGGGPAEKLLSPSTVGFTDASGGFSLLARGGESAVFAIAPPLKSGLPVAVATVDVPPGGGAGWTFTYNPIEKATLTATLSRFGGGSPAAGALVVLSREDATPVGTLALAGKGSAVATGRYRYLLTSGAAGELREVATGAAVLALPAGTYQAEVWPARAETPDQGYRSSTVVLPAGSSSLALALGRRVQLSGSVSGPLGKALPAAARVQITASAGAERSFTGTVDEQGRFELDVDDNSAYTVTARVLGPGGKRLGTLTLASGLLVEGGGSLPQQKLPPAVLYSGTVRAPGGFVVPGALVRLWCDDPGCPTQGDLVDETQSGADGSFELRIPTR
jgi:PAS domain S-box-containing protein